MPNFNRVLLMGHMTRKPETRFTTSGAAVVNFGLAVNSKRKSGDKAMFIDCTAWGTKGETIEKYMDKRSPIFIEGHLELETWEDRTTGAKRSKHTVTVDSFSFVQKSGVEDRPAARQAAPGGDDGIPF